MSENPNEMVELQLARLHNDILGLHFSIIVKEMHDMNVINDDQYRKALDDECKIVSGQIKSGGN